MRGHHLPQRLEAGGAETGLLADPGHPAHLQRLVAQAVAVLEQQQALLGQVVEVQRPGLHQRMPLRHRQHERLLEQRLDVQLLVVQRQGEDRAVQPALAQQAQQGLGLLLHQQQLQAREALAHAGHHVRQQVGPERGEQAQAHAAGLRVAGAPRQFAQLLDVGHDPARALGHLQAHRGEHHAPGRALHQRHAQLVLELADLGAQRGLADEAGRRGLAEVAVVGEGDEVAQVTQVHGGVRRVGARGVNGA